MLSLFTRGSELLNKRRKYIEFVTEGKDCLGQHIAGIPGVDDGCEASLEKRSY